ncbi:unnamed protein product [Leuciscus chuanchicus]
MKKTYTTTEALDYVTEPTDSEPKSDGSVTESASDDDVEFQLTSDSNSSSDSTQSEELDDTKETADPMWTSKKMDSTGHPLTPRRYTTKSTGCAPEVNQGHRVVRDMTDGLEGHTVTTDNFFTSYALAEELLKKKIALVGTIQRNKPELPPHLLQTRARAPRSSEYAFRKTTTAVSYVPKWGKNAFAEHQALRARCEWRGAPEACDDNGLQPVQRSCR